MSVIVGENNYYYNYSTSMIWEDVSIWYWTYYIHRLSTWLYFFDLTWEIIWTFYTVIEWQNWYHKMYQTPFLLIYYIVSQKMYSVNFLLFCGIIKRYILIISWPSDNNILLICTPHNYQILIYIRFVHLCEHRVNKLRQNYYICYLSENDYDAKISGAI